jgi:hypothetical protein
MKACGRAVAGRRWWKGRERRVFMMTWGRLGWLHFGRRCAHRYGGWGWTRGGGPGEVVGVGCGIDHLRGRLHCGLRAGGAAAARGSGILVRLRAGGGQERL